MSRYPAEDQFQEIQIQRMLTTIRATEESSAAITQRLARSVRIRSARSERRRKGTVLIGWGSALGVMVSGSAFALALGTGHLQIIRNVPETPVTEALGEPLPKRRVMRERPGTRTLENTTGALTEHSSLQKNAAGEFERLKNHSVAARTPEAMRVTPQSTAGVEAPRLAPQEEAQRLAKWAEVAQSMRAGSLGEAEEHLATLQESRDEATRESATLLRLQLQLEHSAATAAQLEILRTLAASATQNSVRNGAQRLLAAHQ